MIVLLSLELSYDNALRRDHIELEALNYISLPLTIIKKPSLEYILPCNIYKRNFNGKQETGKTLKHYCIFRFKFDA